MASMTHISCKMNQKKEDRTRQIKRQLLPRKAALIPKRIEAKIDRLSENPTNNIIDAAKLAEIREKVKKTSVLLKIAKLEGIASNDSIKNYMRKIDEILSRLLKIDEESGADVNEISARISKKEVLILELDDLLNPDYVAGVLSECLNESDKHKVVALIFDAHNKIEQSLSQSVEQNVHCAMRAKENPNIVTGEQAEAIINNFEKLKVLIMEEKKNLEVLASANPKYFTGLKPVAEKMAKLLEKAKLILRSFEEFKKKLQSLKGRRLQINDEIIKNAKRFILNDKAIDVLELLIMESKEKRESEYEQFNRQIRDNKKNDDKKKEKELELSRIRT